MAVEPSIVQGMTVSTPTYGYEWGSDAMARTLDELKADGVNWISYHPYARVRGDGSVRVQWDPADPPVWMTRPIEEAHARGMHVLVKPHLAYWGSGFSWRGDITFEDPAARERFFREYDAWITAVASVTRKADAFAVGTELDALTSHEAEWRQIITRVREVHDGHLTYAANWDSVDKVGFWDALDTIGVQAYFPLSEGAVDEPTLRKGWERALTPLRALSRATGKPVVFTELGYDAGRDAAQRPWASGRGHPENQRALLDVALQVVADEPVVRGAFLWKWFPGELQRGDFRMSRPDLRAILRRRWLTSDAASSK